MSEEENTPGDEQGPGEEKQASPGEEGPSEEELRAQLEEEIKKVRVEDVLLQSLVSVLNLSARRLAKEDERDLEQARIGIEAVKASVDFVPEQAQTQLRQAISELQMLYAKHAGGETGEAPSPEKGAPEGPPEAGRADEPQKRRPGDSGLWTPPGT